MEQSRCLDPIKFTQEKLAVELLEPWVEVEPLTNQPQIDVTMRIHLAHWMAEVCTELELEPEVFCLAISCLDRFLSRMELRRQQLQLLGVTCLLVAWKVRGEGTVDVDALVRVSANSLLKQEILECEMLVLTKLNWNLPSAVATDFIHHIAQKLTVKLPMTELRKQVLDLIQTCYVHPALAVKSPQLLAAAAVITVIRPMLQPVTCLETPPTSYSSPTSSLSPFSSLSYPSSSPASHPCPSSPLSSPSPSSSPSTPCNPSTAPPTSTFTTTPAMCAPSASTIQTPSTSSSSYQAILDSPESGAEEEASRPHKRSGGRQIPGGQRRAGGARAKHLSKLDRIIRCVEKVTLSDKSRLQEVCEDIQNLVINQQHAPDTPSPSKHRSPEKSSASASAMLEDMQTPTKLLDASNNL